MPSRRKKAKAGAFSAADVANIAKANPYIQRLIDDAHLRDNVQKAIESTKRAYGRVSNGKAPAKALLEDKKLQNDLREALEAMRDASVALAEAPKRQARKRRHFGRKLMILGLGGGLALIGSEKLRSKVLDTLFGKEEEFQYMPPAGATPSPPATPVTAA
jgi:hypothetical protein